MFNRLGNILTLTTFGESHGKSIGGILDGFPSGVSIDLQYVQDELNKRKPAQSKLVTQRKESDEVKILSGIFEGRSTGHPIGFRIDNENQKSKDYDHLKDTFRPSHADYTYSKKYKVRDHRGGGRSSARETANWVIAGAFAKFLIPEVKLYTYVESIGDIQLEVPFNELDFSIDNEVKCPDATTAQKMHDKIQEIKKAGDTIGGTIRCVIHDVPVGWGEPIFHKLQADLAHAMLSINACKGFEYGSGFQGTQMLGSAHNDLFNEDGSTQTNHSGGIQGGISNGMPIEFRLAFKPVATLMQSQNSIDSKGEKRSVEGKGRHDPCVLPRAVPIVKALASFILADMYLMSKLRKI